MRSSFPLFFAIALIVSSTHSSGIIKICIVGDGAVKNNDTEWRSAIDSIALFIAKNHTKAPQIYEQSGDVCEFVGRVDRAKMRSDFILIVRKNDTKPVDCDVEWGRQSMAIMTLSPAKKPNNSICAHESNKFHASLTFSSTEISKDPAHPIKWTKVSSGAALLHHLWPRFLAPTSRIPEEYSFKAEREERMKRRTLKAVIALMSLVVCSLLVIMFLGSLGRYKESQKLKDQDLKKKKKVEDEAPLIPPTAKAISEKSEKSVKSKEPVEKSAKSAKTEKYEKSGTTEKSESKKLLSNSSKKQE